VTLAEITTRVDDLLEMAREADASFLMREDDSKKFISHDHKVVVSALLDALHTDLAQFAMDLRTLPLEVAA
jgi:fumarate hydratase class II